MSFVLVYSADSYIHGTCTFVCVLCRDSALEKGGALSLDTGNVSSTDGFYMNNTAGGDGGAVSVGNVLFFFFSSSDTYIDNEALSGNGGAIALNNGSVAEFIDSRLLRNTASSKGGALSYQNAEGNLTFNNVSFIDNQSNEDGGGFNVEFGSMSTFSTLLSFLDGTFRNNSAGAGIMPSDVNGGAGASVGADSVSIDSTNFTLNRYVHLLANEHVLSLSRFIVSQIKLAMHRHA